MTQFERVFVEAAARVRFNELRRELTHEEVLIATEYLEKLIASRPKSPAVGKVVPIRGEYVEQCPNGLMPDGDICPKCGGPRAASGVDGGSWVHFPRKSPNEQLREEITVPNDNYDGLCVEFVEKSPSELLQEELEPLPNENLKYAV